MNVEEVLKILESKETAELPELCNELRKIGAEHIYHLCVAALERNCNPNLTYLLLSVLATLLHPLTTIGLINNVATSLLRFGNDQEKAKHLLIKRGISVCLAIASVHAVPTLGIEWLSALISEIDISFSAMYLYELCYALERAEDVELLSNGNYSIIVRILPELLETFVDLFLLDPQDRNLDVVSFYVRHFQEDLLLLLAEKHGNIKFSDHVPELLSSIHTVFNRSLEKVRTSFVEQTDTTSRICLIRYVELLLKFSAPVELGVDLICELAGSVSDVRIVSAALHLLKEVLYCRKEYEPRESFYLFVEYAVQIECPSDFEVSFTDDILDLLTGLTGRFCDGPEALLTLPDAAISPLVQAFLSRQLSSSGPLPEESQMFDDIIEMEVYLTTSSPMENLQIVVAVFDRDAELSTYYWALKIVNQFHKTYSELEHPFIDTVEEVMRRILQLPQVSTWISQSPEIMCEILKMFCVIDDPVGAQSAFAVALSLYTSDPIVMKSVYNLGRKYKFSVEDIANFSMPMTCKVLEQMVKLAPTKFAYKWMNHLLETGETENIVIAASIMRGLLKAQVEINTVEMIPILVRHGLMVDALKIAAPNQQFCLEILALASDWNPDADTKDAFILYALKVAKKFTDPVITDTVLKFIPIEDVCEQRNPELCKSICQLLLEHKLQHKHVTEDSILLSLQIMQSWFPTGDVNPEFLDDVSKLLDFEFETVFPLLSDEFWVSFIESVVFNHHSLMGTSFLRNFSLIDFARYASLMSSVMKSVGYTRSINQEENLQILAKTYQYLRHFC